MVAGLFLQALGAGLQFTAKVGDELAQSSGIPLVQGLVGGITGTLSAAGGGSKILAEALPETGDVMHSISNGVESMNGSFASFYATPGAESVKDNQFGELLQSAGLQRQAGFGGQEQNGAELGDFAKVAFVQPVPRSAEQFFMSA